MTQQGVERKMQEFEVNINLAFTAIFSRLCNSYTMEMEEFALQFYRDIDELQGWTRKFQLQCPYAHPQEEVGLKPDEKDLLAIAFQETDESNVVNLKNPFPCRLLKFITKKGLKNHILEQHCYTNDSGFFVHWFKGKEELIQFPCTASSLCNFWGDSVFMTAHEREHEMLTKNFEIPNTIEMKKLIEQDQNVMKSISSKELFGKKVENKNNVDDKTSTPKNNNISLPYQ